MITILCGSTTCLIFGMIKNMFALWGMPSCTMGFCLGTFIFLFQRDTHKFFQPSKYWGISGVHSFEYFLI